MINNNIINNIMQMLNYNPNDLIKQNPQAQVLINQMQQSGMSMRDFTMQYAKQMGIKFDEYDENEFLTTYYMVISDYPKIANEPHSYLAMAKDWLEDKDSALKGSEKLCAYYYEIIKGGEE